MGKLSDMSEAEAYRLLCEVRFASTNGLPICPAPGCRSKRITIFKNRLSFRCRDCKRDFTVTTDTIWSNSHLPAKLILRATAVFSETANGWAAEEFAALEGLSPGAASINRLLKKAGRWGRPTIRSRWSDCTSTRSGILLRLKRLYQHPVNLHKLREAMGFGNTDVILSGEVEVDSAVFARYHRQHNYAPLRVDRRKIEHPRQMLIGAVRERNGRVLTQVIKTEADFIPFVLRHVARDAIIYTDESANWIKLGDTFTVKTINHKKAYAWGTTNTNSVERFWSRCRCAERGVYINMTGPNFDLFAQELAFRETYHHLSASERFLLVLSLSLQHPPSRRFGGYWQGNRKRTLH